MQIGFNFSHTTKYAIVLAVIALTSLCSHYITNKLIQANQQSAAIINEAGKQRMFSQRVASFATQYAYGQLPTNKQLLQTISQFEQNNQSLLNRITTHQEVFTYIISQTLTEPNPYSKNQFLLDIQQYLDLAKKIATLRNTNTAIKPELTLLLNQANNQILTNLDNAVVWEQKHSEAHLNAINNAQWISFIVIISTIVVGVLGVFRPMVKNSSYLMNLANIDSLTGTLTRRAFSERAKNELSRAKRYNKPLSVLAIDVDHFKKINDHFGHGGGDAALVALGAHIQQSLRTSDFLGRWGGEEFLIMLCETDVEEAKLVAERYRISLADMKIPYGTEAISFTVSIGVAAFSPTTDSLEALINHADNALYQAKNAGRNQVIQFESQNIYTVNNKINRA